MNRDRRIEIRLGLAIIFGWKMSGFIEQRRKDKRKRERGIEVFLGQWGLKRERGGGVDGVAVRCISWIKKVIYLVSR